MKEENLTLEALYSQPENTLENQVEITTTLTTNGTDTDTSLLMWDEAGQFQQTKIQFVNPGVGLGTSIPSSQLHVYNGTGKVWAIATPPEYIGSMGELYRDEHGYVWVMSHDGWKQIVDMSITMPEKEVVKGKKRKLKCF